MLALRYLILTVVLPFFTIIFSQAHAFSWEELREQVLVNRSNVSTFEEIRKKAEENGLRVFLFGGSAATWTRYVLWNMERLAGDTSLNPHRFDFFYDSIFKSTQDIDLMVMKADGSIETEDDLKNFEKSMKEILPGIKIDIHGAQTKFVNSDGVEKESLLNDDDLQKQNSDSASHGIIELTTQTQDSKTVFDLRTPNDEPLFLKAFSSGQIEFLSSEEHWKTDRAKRGDNPEILGAIRAISNTFRYDLELSEDSMKKIKGIVDAFDPDPKSIRFIPHWIQNLFRSIFKKKQNISPYVVNWIETNAKKLFQHAISLEKAWNFIEDIGLRKKLIIFSKVNSDKKERSLAQLLSKRPLGSRNSLLSRSIKWGKIKTPKKSHPDGIVTHETPDIAAYESIIANPRGVPNFLVSVDGNGGMAVAGDGVYVREGLVGAANPDEKTREMFAIQLQMAGAQYGEDFKEGGNEDHLIFRTNDALKILLDNDSMPDSPVEGFKKLLSLNLSKESALAGRIARRMRSMTWSESDFLEIRKEFIFRSAIWISKEKSSQSSAKKAFSMHKTTYDRDFDRLMAATFGFHIPQLESIGIEYFQFISKLRENPESYLHLGNLKIKRIKSALDQWNPGDAIPFFLKVLPILFLANLPYYSLAIAAPLFLPAPIFVKAVGVPISIYLARKFQKWNNATSTKKLIRLLYFPYIGTLNRIGKKYEDLIYDIRFSNVIERNFRHAAESNPHFKFSGPGAKKFEIVATDPTVLPKWRDCMDSLQRDIQDALQKKP